MSSGEPSPALASREEEPSGTDWRALATALIARLRVAEDDAADQRFRAERAEAELARLRGNGP